MMIIHVSHGYTSRNGWNQHMWVNAMKGEIKGSRWNSTIDSMNSNCLRI